MIDFPLSKNESIKIKSKTGKKIDDINMKNVIGGNVNSEDIKISTETLHLQGQVARQIGRNQLGENFDRASELVNVEDELILEIYDKLRPNRATKQELLNYADILSTKYNATKCAELIKEAVMVYERRGLLLK